MLFHLFLFFLGFVLLLAGGELSVLCVRSLSVRYRLPAFLVSAILVGMATSLPEFVVTFYAGLEGHSTLGVGNVLGSNVCNLLLILPLATLVRPISLAPLLHSMALLLVIVSVLLVIFGFYPQEIRWPVGLAMLLLYTFYMGRSVRRAKTNLPHVERRPRLGWWFVSIFALVLLIAGGRLVILEGVFLAQQLHLGHAFVGFFVLALGTSLPELAAALAASRRGLGDIVLGNLLGSNLFNTLVVLGITTFTGPLSLIGPRGEQQLWFNLGILLLFLGMAVAPRFWHKSAHLNRWSILPLLGLYGLLVVSVW